MVTQIIAGVYQLKVPIPNSPLEATNIYIIQGDKGYTLIDTGWNSETAFNSLNRQLAEVGIGLPDIAQIVITHAHFDHYGLTGRIKNISGAQISLHKEEKETIRTRYNVPDEFLAETEKWFTAQGVPAAMLEGVRVPIRGFREALPAQPDVWLNGEETIPCGEFNLKVVWTPGHTTGHVCYYEPVKKLLFTGDHVLPLVTPNISMSTNSTGNPLGDYINSLMAVRKLDVKLALPGHGEAFKDLPKRVDEIVKHHVKRTAEIQQALQGSEKTAYQLADVITWMPEQGGVKHAALSPVSKLAAVSETLAHLRALEAEKKVAAVKHDDIVYYKDI
jgi:glyoxylase-like metal-dependent hydrolase (beta-lactamase superfamily II)